MRILLSEASWAGAGPELGNKVWMKNFPNFLGVKICFRGCENRAKLLVYWVNLSWFRRSLDTYPGLHTLYGRLHRLYGKGCTGYLEGCTGYMGKLHRLYGGFSDNAATWRSQFQPLLAAQYSILATRRDCVLSCLLATTTWGNTPAQCWDYNITEYSINSVFTRA